jgi:hypothetical protein
LKCQSGYQPGVAPLDPRHSPRLKTGPGRVRGANITTSIADRHSVAAVSKAGPALAAPTLQHQRDQAREVEQVRLVRDPTPFDLRLRLHGAGYQLVRKGSFAPGGSELNYGPA